MNAFVFALFCLAFVALVVWLIRKNRQLLEQRGSSFSTHAHDAGPLAPTCTWKRPTDPVACGWPAARSDR